MWSAVFICMVIIVSVWAWSFGRSVRLAQQENRQGRNEIPEPLRELQEKAPSLWQSLGAGIKSLFGDLEEKIPSAEEIEIGLPVEMGPELNEFEGAKINETRPARLPEIK